MPSPRGEERWVAACIEAALPRVAVKPNDDGSRPGMYDLDLLRDGTSFGACEVTAAADAASIELWNLVNGRSERWVETGLLGGWNVSVTPACRAKRLQKELPGILRVIETDEAGSWGDDTAERLDDLGVVSAHRGATNSPEVSTSAFKAQRSAQVEPFRVPETASLLARRLDSRANARAQPAEAEISRTRRTTPVRAFPGFTTAPFPVGLADEDGCADTRGRAATSGWHHPRLGYEHVVAGDVYRYGSGGWRRSKKVFIVSGDS